MLLQNGVDTVFFLGFWKNLPNNKGCVLRQNIWGLVTFDLVA